jgi:hypothetical protein
MANLKTSKRNRLETEEDLWIALSQIESRWNLLCENTQGQSSHKIFLSIFILFYIFVQIRYIFN